MSATRGVGLAAYARAVEREWTELVGAPWLLSPRDWSLLQDWYERGIPLAVLREAISAAGERMRKGRSRSIRRGLGYLAPAVEEAWAAVRDGRLAPPTASRSTAPEPGPASVLTAWRRVAAELPPGSALGMALGRACAAFEASRPAEEIDRQLDDALPGSVSGERLERCSRRVDRELEAHRTRMSPDSYRATRLRGLVDGLRRELGLPRLGDSIRPHAR